MSELLKKLEVVPSKRRPLQLPGTTLPESLMTGYSGGRNYIVIIFKLHVTTVLNSSQYKFHLVMFPTKSVFPLVNMDRFSCSLFRHCADVPCDENHSLFDTYTIPKHI